MEYWILGYYVKDFRNVEALSETLSKKTLKHLLGRFLVFSV